MKAKTILSWVLYYLGCSACWVMELATEQEWWVNFWYSIYNWLMIKSVDLQAKDPNGPWQ